MSDHKHTDGCNCGHDHEEEYEILTLSLDDDSDLDCVVLEKFPLDDKIYIALQPMDEEDEPSIHFFQYIEDDEDIELVVIEDDDEFEAVIDAYEELIDMLDFDESDEELED